MRTSLHRFFTHFLFLLPVSVCIAQENNALTSDTSWTVQLPEIQLLSPKDNAFPKLPGSVAKLTKLQLLRSAPLTANEMLRSLAGVQVVDEEGAGLRTNIGIRGLDPDRSRAVLVLEDGIPVALNPYGEPEMYYSPLIDRMSGIDLVKGSGQILFGPQTIGGVINYKTANPPEKQTIGAKMCIGEHGFSSTMLQYGNTLGKVGLQANFIHKRADKLGYASFIINDATAKMNFAFSSISKIGVKLAAYEEESNATYIGLTQNMFEQGGQDFVLMAPDDLLKIKRLSASATHELTLSERLKLKTTAFKYSTTRNWRRQDFSNSATASNQTGVVWGNSNIANGAVYMRNSTGNRNRQFEVGGIEPQLVFNYANAKIQGEWQSGARILLEKAYEQRINGKKYNASAGDIVEDEIRKGTGFSAYSQHQLTAGKWVFTTGVRFENFAYERNILRNTFKINNISTVRDTNLLASSRTHALIPGLGINFNTNHQHTFYAGIHRGFAPPRVKDAITATGEAYNLEAEKSWNSELGWRGKSKNDAWTSEITAYLMEFSNQIIPVSESSGGTGSGLVNGGKTRHLGLELALGLHFNQFFETKYLFSLQINGSYNRSTFEADRLLIKNGERVNVKGNITPYSPTFHANANATFETPFGLGLQLNAFWQSKQFSDELNTVLPSADGRTGVLPAHKNLDASIFYRLPKRAISFHCSVKNVSNERYISSRRPQGIRVSLPRFLTVGASITL